jgi:hypothetical protein
VLKDQKRATYIGMLSGRAVALAMAAGGLFFIVRAEYEGGWLLLMAWFLWRAAGESYHAMLARDLLKRVTVGEIMRAPLHKVSEALSLRELAESFASWLRPPALAVDVNGNAVGLVGIDQVKKIERAKWESTRVRQAMLPLTQDGVVAPHDAALLALKRLTENERDELAVMQDGQVMGIVGRQELARYLAANGE